MEEASWALLFTICVRKLFLSLSSLRSCLSLGLWRTVRSGWRWTRMGSCAPWPLTVRSSCCDWNTSEDGSVVCWRSVNSAQTHQQTWAQNIRKEKKQQNSVILALCCCMDVHIRLCLFGPHVLSLLTHLLNYEARQDLDGDFSMHFVDVFLIELSLYIGSGWCYCFSVWDHSIVMLMNPPPPGTFCMPSTVSSQNKAWLCFFIWKVHK